MNPTMDQMTEKEQIRAIALAQAAPLVMMLAQTTGQMPTMDKVLDLADKLVSYIQSGIRTA